MTKAPIFKLIQTRYPDDPICLEEICSFGNALGLKPEDILVFNAYKNSLTQTEMVLKGADALLIGGSGNFGINDSHAWLKDLVKGSFLLCKKDIPIFASCFGFHMLAVAFGGTVHHDLNRTEVGSTEVFRTKISDKDELFSSLPSSMIAQQGHKDSIIIFPDEFIHLAYSSRCFYQAFRIKNKPIWATQFHPELTKECTIGRLSNYRDMYEKTFGKGFIEQLQSSITESTYPADLLRSFRSMIEN